MGGRKWVFRLAAVVGVPSLFFGLMELGLRLVGVGYPASFFVRNPAPGERTLIENRLFSRRYFAPQLMRTPRSVAFTPAKPRGTLRIFVFGESAAEGDPGPPFGFARVLQVLLQDWWPDRKIELINTSVTAIDSHVIRPIARECAGYGGDVWVIYMGNNEVVGPFGSGTVFGAQVPSLDLIRATIRLKSIRTVQLLDDIFRRFTRQRAPSAWAGMEMFLEQQVPWNDPRMAKVYAYFESNLSDIIQFGAQSGAKVIVSTVGSNLRDCAPFASKHRSGLTARQEKGWDRLYQAGVALEAARQYAPAVAQYQLATRLDDQFAELHFRLGRCQAALGNRSEALEEFARARDLDTLRFRADTRINEIIRQVAARWKPRGVRLADVEAALRRSSRDGIPGREWFYEHVHLTFQGNYLVARQLAEQVVESFDNRTPGRRGSKSFLSIDECANRLGLTDCDRLLMAQEMLRRASGPPFTHQLDHGADAARREKMVAELRQRDQTNFEQSVAIYRRALARWDQDWQLHDDFAGALLLHGHPEEAAAQWQRVAQLLPHRVQTYDLIGSILIEREKFEAAADWYRHALAIQPDFVEGWIGLGRAHLGQRHFEEAVAQFRRAIKLKPSARANNHLGIARLEMGQPAEGEAQFRTALRLDPDFVPARLNLGSALLDQGKVAEAITNDQAIVRAHPNDAAAWKALGKALTKEGRLAEAIPSYQQAVRLQPEDFEAQYALAIALIRSKQISQALEHLVTAVRLRPGSAEARLNYGAILANEGRASEARAQFEKAVRLKPDFAQAHLNLALALIDQGEVSQAIAHLREVLRLDPANQRAGQLLKSLR